MVRKCEPKRGTFLKYRRYESIRTFNAASNVLLYLLVFKTEVHDELLEKSESSTAAEVLEKISDVLIGRGEDFHKLCAFLKAESDGEECILGIESQEGYLTKEQFAALVLSGVESLYRPLDIRTGPPEDF